MEDIILDQICSSNDTPESTPKAKQNSDVHQYNILLSRQQKLTQRKQHISSPMALEARARHLLGANSEERMINDDMH